MTAVLEYWPLLLLPALLAAAPWVRRRNWIRAARRHWRAHPSIDQASHDRAPAVQEPRCRMCDHPVSHHDAGECWTDANGNEVDSDSVCPCWWLTLPGEEPTRADDGMTHYNDGRRFEYKVRDALAADGYEVIRAAGSKGKVDLVAFKSIPDGPDVYRFAWDASTSTRQMLFVQAKRRDGNIGREDRAELVRLASIAGALPIVAHQPLPRRPIQYRRLTGPGPKDWQPWTPDEVTE